MTQRERQLDFDLEDFQLIGQTSVDHGMRRCRNCKATLAHSDEEHCSDQCQQEDAMRNCIERDLL